VLVEDMMAFEIQEWSKVRLGHELGIKLIREIWVSPSAF